MERSIVDELTQEVTQDFVESFENEAEFDGPFFGLCCSGLFPLGVNPNDHRVIEIMRRCVEARKARRDYPFGEET